MVNEQWIKELTAFKKQLAENVQLALNAYITANEHDDGPEFWNDEFGMDARDAFTDFIKFLDEWEEGQVDIRGIK